MNDNAIDILTGMVAGAGLACCYFGGLWFTVARMSRWKRPLFWVLLSYWLRTGMAAGVFILLTLWFPWTALVGGAAGFIGMRMVLVRLAKSGMSSPAAKGARL